MCFTPKKWAAVPFTFFQIVALSSNIYIVPQLVIYKVCLKAFNQSVCDQLGQLKFKAQEDIVFERAAEWNSLINFAVFFPALVLTLPLGAMTDLVSKKKMLLLPAIVSLVSCLLNLFSSIFIKLHIGFIVLASVVTSIFGEIPGSIALACTYAASSCPHDRTLVIAMVVAACEFGSGAGGLVENFLQQYFGFPTVFLFTVILLIINLLYVIALMPNLNDSTNSSVQRKQYNIWAEFNEHLRYTLIHLISFTKKYLLYSKDNTILLLLMAAFFNLASLGGERVLITLFLKHRPLSLTSYQMGIYITLIQSGKGLGLILLAFISRCCYTPSDYTLMIIGAASMVATYTIISFSETTLMLYLSAVPSIWHVLMVASVRSQLTKLVEADEYGAVLSYVGIINLLSDLLMSQAANALFAATAKVYSGLSILLMSGSCLVCLVILCYIVCTKQSEPTATNTYDKLSTKEENNEG